MEKIRVDYLNNHVDYKVCQHEDMYHFNSDTCLLGEFIKINENDYYINPEVKRVVLPSIGTNDIEKFQKRIFFLYWRRKNCIQHGTFPERR